MRILIAASLYPPESGGPATYAALLMRELPKRGIEAGLLRFSEVRHLPNGIRQIAYFFRVLGQGRGADIIYAQDTVSVGWPAYFASLFLRATFMVRVPGDHIWEQGVQRFGLTGSLDQMSRFSWRWHPYLMFLRMLQYFVIHGADAIVVPSDYMKRTVMRWGADPKRVHVIYSSIELPVETEAPLDFARGKPNGFLIVTVARLVPWKGVDRLISVVAGEHDWNLVVVDDGPERQRLEALAKKSGAADRIRFTGRLPRAQALGWVAAADVFVLNSTYEGLSHLLVETMSLGTPVVATAVGGNTELIENGKTGLLIAPENNAELQDAIRRMRNDERLRSSLGAAARERTAAFSIERTVGDLVVLMQKL